MYFHDGTKFKLDEDATHKSFIKATKANEQKVERFTVLTVFPLETCNNALERLIDRIQQKDSLLLQKLQPDFVTYWLTVMQQC